MAKRKTKNAKTLKHVTIIGTGLLGGSVGLAVRRAFPGVEVAGVGRRRASLNAAKRKGCVHTVHLDPAEAVNRSDLVILATPVGAFEAILRQIQPCLKRGAIVTDVGSTKAEVVRIAERVLGCGGAFVGSHPMAGNENKGPAFAATDLLAGAPCIITPTKHTPPAKAKRVEEFWASLGMRTLRMTPAVHDRAAARVSHLPHLLACLLMLQPADDDLAISSTGLQSTTRLASGDPEMWRDIMATNRKAILATMDKFQRDMTRLRNLLDADNAAAIERFFAKAKTRRDETIG